MVRGIKIFYSCRLCVWYKYKDKSAVMCFSILFEEQAGPVTSCSRVIGFSLYLSAHSTSTYCICVITSCVAKRAERGTIYAHKHGHLTCSALKYLCSRTQSFASCPCGYEITLMSEYLLSSTSRHLEGQTKCSIRWWSFAFVSFNWCPAPKGPPQSWGLDKSGRAASREIGESEAWAVAKAERCPANSISPKSRCSSEKS